MYSAFEARLFRPQREYSRLMDEYGRHRERIPEVKILCDRASVRPRKGLTCTLDDVDESFFWPSHSSTARPMVAEIRQVRCTWDCEYLYVTAKVVEIGSCGHNELAARRTALIVIISNLPAYRSTLIADYGDDSQGTVWSPTSSIPGTPRLIRAEGARSSSVGGSDGTTVELQIRWEAIGLKPFVGLEMRFEIGLMLDDFLEAFSMFSGNAFDFGGFVPDMSKSDVTYATMQLTDAGC